MRVRRLRASRLTLYDPKDPVVRQLAERWSNTVLAFARTGDPNGGGLPHWSPYSADRRGVLILDAASRIEQTRIANCAGGGATREETAVMAVVEGSAAGDGCAAGGRPPGDIRAMLPPLPVDRWRVVAYAEPMAYVDRITIEPGKRGGKPCIRGLRMTVAGRARLLGVRQCPKTTCSGTSRT